MSEHTLVKRLVRVSPAGCRYYRGASDLPYYSFEARILSLVSHSLWSGPGQSVCLGDARTI